MPLKVGLALLGELVGFGYGWHRRLSERIGLLRLAGHLRRRLHLHRAAKLLLLLVLAESATLHKLLWWLGPVAAEACPGGLCLQRLRLLLLRLLWRRLLLLQHEWIRLSRLEAID